MDHASFVQRVLMSEIIWILAACGSGFGNFFVALYFAVRRARTRLGAASLEGFEAALVRTLLTTIKRLLPCLALCALPLVHVAAFTENPVGNKDVTIVYKDKSWLFWYPRGITSIVSHTLLGPNVGTHPALRWFYITCLVGMISLDSISFLLLEAQRRCIKSTSCDVPHGHTTGSITFLLYRDLIALSLQTWALLLLVFVMTAAGFCHHRYSLGDVSSKYTRPKALHAERLRCGFLTQHRPHQHKPVFGLNGEYNAKQIQSTTKHIRGTKIRLPHRSEAAKIRPILTDAGEE